MVLVHDVNRMASKSVANRTALNRDFAALATSLISDENHWGTEVAATLANAPQSTRPAFATDLQLERSAGRELRQRAEILATPDLAHHVQEQLIDVTEQRVSTTVAFLNHVGQLLALPGFARPVVGANMAGRQLRHADLVWAHARRSLIGEPGRVRLPRSEFALAAAPLSSDLAAILSAPALRAERAVTIATIEVTPTTLPAASGQLVELPGSPLGFAVVVRNEGYINQRVTVHLSVLNPTAGASTSVQSLSGVIGPLNARAFTFAAVPIVASEHATVNVLLSGAPIAAGGVGTKHYRLIVAPSPTS